MLSSSRALLRDLASDLRERGVGVTADQPHCADDDDQDHGQHDGVLGDVLSLLIAPEKLHNIRHRLSPHSVCDGHEVASHSPRHKTAKCELAIRAYVSNPYQIDMIWAGGETNSGMGISFADSAAIW